MPRKRTRKPRARASRKTTPKTVRRQTPRRRAKRRHAAPKEKHVNALVVFVMFLYMLKLITKKQFKSLQRELSPKKKTRTKQNRRR